MNKIAKACIWGIAGKICLNVLKTIRIILKPDLIIYIYISQHLKWINKVHQSCPKTRTERFWSTWNVDYILYSICILYFFLLCDFVFLNMFQIFGICLAQNLVSDVRAVKANWWPFAEGDSDRWQWPDYGRELIVNQHSLHITELGISALFTLQMLYVSWLYKIDCPSVFLSFFVVPYLKTSSLSKRSLRWDVTLRSSYLWSRSCLLTECYFRLPLLKRSPDSPPCWWIMSSGGCFH